MRRPLPFLLLALMSVIMILYSLDSPLVTGRSAFTGLDGEVASFEGTVSSVRIRDSYTELVLDCGRESVLVRLKVPGREGAGSPEPSGGSDMPEQRALFDLCGRRAKAAGQVSLPQGLRNRGGFDYRRYLMARDIYVIADVSRFRFEAGAVERPLIHLASVMKGRFFEAMRPRMDADSFAVAAGMLFGDKSYMDDEVREMFVRTGSAHVLAVSGLHVSLLFSLSERLTGKRKTAAASAAAALILLFYGALSSFSVPVTRALVMTGLKMAAFRLRRRYDPVSAACLSAGVLMLKSPLYLLDAGFQLSFAAAFAMGIVLPRFEAAADVFSDRIKNGLPSAVLSVFGASAAAFVTMGPLCLYYFGWITPLSVFYNVFVIAAAAVILPAGLFVFAAVNVFPGCAALEAVLGGALSRICGALLLFSKACVPPGDSPAVPVPTEGAVILYYAMLLWFFSETRHMLRRRGMDAAGLALSSFIVLCSCLAPFLLGVSPSPIPWDYAVPPFTFIDVGQGDSVHVYSEGFSMLVDGGGGFGRDTGEDVLAPYLRACGITALDLAVVTHMDADHAKGIEDLCSFFDVGCVAFPSVYEGDPRAESFPARKRLFLSAGDRIELKGAVIEVLSPPEGAVRSADDNENCLVLSVRSGGITALLTADLGFDGENALLASCLEKLDCDVLKAGHHGSAFSTGAEFLAAASPSAAVISCGAGNPYGHPAARVLELLSDSGIIYARTDLSGAVSVSPLQKGGFSMFNARKDARWLIRKSPQESTPSGRL